MAMSSVKQDAVQEIKDRLDLVDLVSEHLRLQKAGRDLKGLCPFHQEKTPSFYVSQEKQLWHCYGCQKGGDHFTFIQDIEHVDFKGALRLLADKTGVVLEESPGAGRQRELKRTIQRLNLLAAQYFHHILLENQAGQRALIQLESRGVTRASMTEFQLGFAPAGQRKDNLVRFLRKHGVFDRELVDAGLAISPHPDPPPQRGREMDLWDRFRQRIMIPIHDEHGELVAFGGRVIDDTNQPKYLNTTLDSPPLGEGRVGADRQARLEQLAIRDPVLPQEADQVVLALARRSESKLELCHRRPRDAA